MRFVSQFLFIPEGGGRGGRSEHNLRALLSETPHFLPILPGNFLKYLNLEVVKEDSGLGNFHRKYVSFLNFSSIGCSNWRREKKSI